MKTVFKSVIFHFQSAILVWEEEVHWDSLNWEWLRNHSHFQLNLLSSPKQRNSDEESTEEEDAELDAWA